MHEAPEGLEYGTNNYKYARANKSSSELEKGKWETGRDPSYEAINKAAEVLRMKDGGCCDPAYAEKRKNMS